VPRVQGGAILRRDPVPAARYRLLAWQRKVLRDVYGTVSSQDGRRRYRSGYISVGKKNGKSFLIGGLPLYHLLMEDERNPEAYGAAALRTRRLSSSSSGATGGGQPASASPAQGTALDQAHPAARRRRLLCRSSRRMAICRTASSRAWPSGTRCTAGRRCAPRPCHDVITKGQISREEPLDLGITTAGAEYESPLWWREYQHAKQVLDGSLRSDTFYGAIWEADVKRIESDPEYWKSREARIAANPSHEDLGGFLKDSAIVGELDKALAEPSSDRSICAIT